MDQSLIPRGGFKSLHRDFAKKASIRVWFWPIAKKGMALTGAKTRSGQNTGKGTSIRWETGSGGVMGSQKGQRSLRQRTRGKISQENRPTRSTYLILFLRISSKSSPGSLLREPERTEKSGTLKKSEHKKVFISKKCLCFNTWDDRFKKEFQKAKKNFS